ncbi:MAG TPA: enolase C-terminal domain-like protein [Acidimicrobiia bacterium]|nr:enolase C-terminal domain-like protein [Acidimicrobiia bacterium]
MNQYRLRLGARDVTLLHGPAGWGECSPLPGYPCSLRAAQAAAEEAACTGWPEPVRDAVPVNALVADGPLPDPMSLAGYPCVKLKVGRRAPDEDVDRVAAVRDMVAPSTRVRVDANGAWDLDTAVSTLSRLARFDVELAEQPVASLDDLARIRRRVAVAVAADECVRGVDDARRLRSLDAADAVVVKVQPLGGVRAALDVAQVAAVPAIVTSMMETSVGVAAGVALACALPELPYACGLATAALLDHDVVAEPLVPASGVIRRRAVTPDPALLERYAVTR